MQEIDTKLITEIVQHYERNQFDRLVKLVQFITRKLESKLAEEGTLARVSARVKSSDSLYKKLEKWASDPKKAKRLKGDYESVLRRVNDLAAARVMAYTEADRDIVSRLVQKTFASPKEYKNKFDIEKKEDDERVKSNKYNYYRATHLMVSLKTEDLSGRYSNLELDKCEIQITSFLAHVWNEIEHDIIYKKEEGVELSLSEMNAIDSLGLLTKTGDNIINSLLQARNQRENQEQTKIQYENDRLNTSTDTEAFLESYFGQKVNGHAIEYRGNVDDFHSCLEALEWNYTQIIPTKFSPSLLKESRNQILSIKRFMSRNNRTRPTLDENSSDLFTVAAMILMKDVLAEKFSTRHKNTRELAMLNIFIESRD